MSVYYAAITSEGRGACMSVPRPARSDRHVPLDPHATGRMLGSGLARLALLMLEAGAEEVYPSYPGRADRAHQRRDLASHAVDVRRVQGQRHDGAPVLDGADGRRRPTMRCRLVRTCARNDQRLGQRRVVAADAPGVNPQATVMALSIRNARRLLPRTERPAWLIADDSPPDVTVVTGAAGWLGRPWCIVCSPHPPRHRLRLLAHTTASANDLRRSAASRSSSATSSTSRR